MRRTNRWLLSSLVVSLGSIAIGIVLYVLFAERVVEAAYRGGSLPLLDDLVARHRLGRPWATPEHYLRLARLMLTRIVVVVAILQFLAATLIYRRELSNALRRFFNATAHPLSLAVFRIVLFSQILIAIDDLNLPLYADIPSELQVAPLGAGWLLRLVPIGPIWLEGSANLLRLCCLGAIVGLYSRACALLAVIIGVYVLGVPQFFGKVNHYHHLLWFGAILAASRCGDALSLDAAIASIRRADRAVLAAPSPSRAYALPLRFTWLLIGLMYFFPGFWKLWTSGVDWIWSDNLKFTMYGRWVELGGWMPPFRIDRYPLLCKLGAMATVGFEVSAIFLVFSQRLRLLVPLGGFVFHNVTYLFMRIYFTYLVRCYVAFFDWERIFRWIGRRIFREEISIVYDPVRDLDRRAVTLLQAFDVLGRVRYHPLPTGRGIEIRGDRNRARLAAYGVLAIRAPLFVLVAPILLLWPRPTAAGAGTASFPYTTDLEPSLLPVNLVGACVLLASLLTGALSVERGWPVACYPTFAWIAVPTVDLLEIVAVDTAGKRIDFNEREPIPGIPADRFSGLMNQVLRAPADRERQTRIRALWRLYLENNPDLRQTKVVQFYEVAISTLPERHGAAPVDRKLLLEWRPDEQP